LRLWLPAWLAGLGEVDSEGADFVAADLAVVDSERPVFAVAAWRVGFVREAWEWVALAEAGFAVVFKCPRNDLAADSTAESLAAVDWVVADSIAAAWEVSSAIEAWKVD
jgi:hypothetical protein